MLILGIFIGVGVTLVLGLCAAASDAENRIETRNEADRARREANHENP